MTTAARRVVPQDIVTAPAWLIEAAAAGRLVVLDQSMLSARERKDLRDAAIRESRVFFSDCQAVAARELSAAMTRVVERGEHLKELPEGASAFQVLIHKIVTLNKGASLCQRQINSIFDGVRCS